MDIILRKATESDCDLLYQWVNDVDVRVNSFSPRDIPYQEHLKWFREKLSSYESIIYICLLDKTPIGQIRIDIENEDGIIDYSIDKAFRGKGYGSFMLKKAEEEIKRGKLRLNKLVGRVKHHNIASQKAFIKAGFNSIESVTHVEFVKNI